MQYFVDLFDAVGNPLKNLPRKSGETFRVSVRLENDPIDTTLPVPTTYRSRTLNLEDLIEILKTLPKRNGFFIQLSTAVLEETSITDLQTLFSTLTPKLRSFRFHWWNNHFKGVLIPLNKTASNKSQVTWKNEPLHLISKATLLKLIDALAPQVVVIELSNIHLTRCKQDDLRFLTTLNSRIKSFEFECDEWFDTLSVHLEQKPKTKKTIDWSDARISLVPVDVLIKLVKAISPKVTRYILKNTDLFRIPYQSLEKLLMHLPAQINYLSFADNTPSAANRTEIPRLIPMLPIGLVSLDLSGINGMNSSELLPINTFKGLIILLPHSLKKLILQNNQLDQYYLGDLVALLLTIDPNIVLLDLRENNLELYSVQYTRAIAKGLVKRKHPTYIENAFITKVIIQEVTTLAEHDNFYPLLKRLKLDLLYFPVIHLLTLTQHFRSMPANLTVGLYLTDKIYIEHDDLSAWQKSREARMHSALTYFLKAYTKPSLRNAVHLLLWQMGEGLDLPASFADRLGRLNTPHPSSLVTGLPTRLRRTVGFFTPIPNEGRIFNSSEDKEIEIPIASNQAIGNGYFT